MKKCLSLVCLALLSVAPVFAQNRVFNNPDNKGYWGLRLAGEVTCPGDVKVLNIGVSTFKNGGGVEFGGIYNIPVVANFYIEPGVKLYYNSYSIKDGFVDNYEDDYGIESDISLRKFGMRIPVMAGYHFDITDNLNLAVFTGPELEIGFSAKEHAKLSGVNYSESLYGEEGGMNRVDLLWGIGAGVTYRHLYFGISGGIGMLNMMDDTEAKFHENRVSFTVGYNF